MANSFCEFLFNNNNNKQGYYDGAFFFVETYECLHCVHGGVKIRDLLLSEICIVLVGITSLLVGSLKSA